MGLPLKSPPSACPISVLKISIRATFDRRGTAIPNELPIALTPAFVQLPEKLAQWNGFLPKTRTSEVPKDLTIVLSALAEFLGPVFEAASRKTELLSVWPPGGPWKLAGKNKDVNS
jgi:hypothetical protein